MKRTIVSMLSVAACAALQAASAEDAAVSFKKDLLPVLTSQCVFCHVTGAENADLNLGRRQAYQDLMSASSQAPMPRVTPGKPDESYLIHKLKNTQNKAGGSGNRMPMTDPPRPMDADQLSLFVEWIEAGAPDN